MADYIVKDTELTSVANAIRTAGGTNSLLSFPNGFVSAVNNISGGSSSDFSVVTVTFDNKTSHGVYDIYGCFALNGENGDPDISYPQVEAPENAVTTYNLILYKGTADIYINDNAITCSIFGDIEGDFGDYLVTGDCIITISTTQYHQ